MVWMFIAGNVAFVCFRLTMGITERHLPCKDVLHDLKLGIFKQLIMKVCVNLSYLRPGKCRKISISDNV